MFPRFREQIDTALDLIVEFSTLGEYRLGAAEAAPGAPGAPADAPGPAPQLGGASRTRTAVRRIVAGGAAGLPPVATPAARRGHACSGERSRGRARPAAPEQLCLAV